MKVQLLFDNSKEARRDWTVLDPLAGDDDPGGRIRCELFPTKNQPGLAAFIEANEAEKIVADGVLEHYAASTHEELVTHWVSRLRQNGQLTVVAVDAPETARRLADEGMAIWNLSLLPQTESGLATLSLLSLRRIVELFEKAGLTVSYKEYIDRKDKVLVRVVGDRR